MNIRPLHDRVLVKRIEQEEQVRGGIIIPDTAKEKPQEAEVVAVGPGKLNDEGKRAPMDVQEGDRVLMGKYSGSEIKIDGNDYVILREDEILAVVGQRQQVSTRSRLSRNPALNLDIHAIRRQ